MFRIKVCGVTRFSDLEVLKRSGVDAVGINLVPGSPRYVAPVQAGQLCKAARQLGLTSVLVVMNLEAQYLSDQAAEIAPDVLQLHGHEEPEYLNDYLLKWPLIKAISWSGRAEEMALAQRWQAARLDRLAFLVDAYAPGAGGGTGRVARWDLLWPRPPVLAGYPLILAGGLGPDNVVQAIEATRCDGVDTASGVESAPGIKDAEKVARFARASSHLP